MRWNFSGFAVISLASIQFKAASVSLISSAKVNANRLLYPLASVVIIERTHV